MRFSLSQGGQNFIKLNELSMTTIPPGSQYLTPFMDPCQCQYDVGWGHALPANDVGGTITPAQAQAYFNQDTESALSTLDSTVHIPLNSNQVAACTDFIYTTGPGGWASSGIPAALNAGDINGAANLMKASSLGCGLSNARRYREAALLTGASSLTPGGQVVPQ